MTISRRRRVRAAMIELTSVNGVLVTAVAPLSATRLAHGDVHHRRVINDDTGQLEQRPVSMSQAERMAMDGALGDDVALLLIAAAWFTAIATEAGLRGRLGRSSLIDQGPVSTTPVRIARARLARLYDAIGADAFNILVDGCVWDQFIPRRRYGLFRAALHGVAQWREKAG